MEITFRQLQRMTVKELQELTKDGDLVVTVDSQADGEDISWEDIPSLETD